MSTRQLEVEVLKKRSLMFLEESERALNSRYYDIACACFLAEQALQLHLKALLLDLETTLERVALGD